MNAFVYSMWDTAKPYNTNFDTKVKSYSTNAQSTTILSVRSNGITEFRFQIQQLCKPSSWETLTNTLVDKLGFRVFW